MDRVRKLISEKLAWVIASLVIIVTLALGAGVYFANASAGAGWSGSSGGHDVSGSINCRRLYFDKIENDGTPVQGWNEDGIDYFYDGMKQVMGMSLSDASYQLYVEAAEDAIYKARVRDVNRGLVDSYSDSAARIVAVAWIYTESGGQGHFAHSWNLSGNNSSAEQMMPRPGTTGGAVVNGLNGASESSADWVLDEWQLNCEIPGHENETWYDYIYNTAMLDVSGEDANGNIVNYDQWMGKNLSCIVVAASQYEAIYASTLTLNKDIYGCNFPQGSYERLIYESTLDNSCYDLSGAEFTIYENNNGSVGEIAKVASFDANGNILSTSTTKADAVFTTNADGSCSQIYRLRQGKYWLQETKAPNKGFYRDKDLDGIRDELDKSEGNGISLTVKGSKIYVNDEPLTSVGKFAGGDHYVLDGSNGIIDEPMDDPQPIYLGKRDSLTGEFTPVGEGMASTNGAVYRFAYFKGVYNRVEGLPGYDRNTGKVDWSKADTTALWTTHDWYQDGLKYSGMIAFNVDDPSEGTWKYKRGFNNICPMGTLAIVEVIPPQGYLIDDRIYLYSVTDDGTHTLSGIDHTPWNADGSNGTSNRDWNHFLNEYELNGDRDDITTIW